MGVCYMQEKWNIKNIIPKLSEEELKNIINQKIARIIVYFENINDEVNCEKD